MIPRISDHVRDKGSQRTGTVTEVTKSGAVVKFDGYTYRNVDHAYLSFDRLEPVEEDPCSTPSS